MNKEQTDSSYAIPWNLSKMKLLANRHRPLLLFNSKIVTYHLGKLTLMNVDNGKSEEICSLPIGMVKHYLCTFRLFERLFHIEPKTAARVSSTSFILAFQGKIYYVCAKTKQIKAEHSFTQGMSSPLGFAIVQNIHGFEDGILYGEYISNKDRKKSVGIFHRSLLLLFICPVCTTRCDPIDCRMPDFTVLHHFLELAQTHVH